MTAVEHNAKQSLPDVPTDRHPGEAKPYPGSQHMEAPPSLRSWLALRLAGMTMPQTKHLRSGGAERDSANT